MDKLLSLREVTATTSLGKTSIYVLIQKNSFPKPVKLSPRRVAWKASEIQSWIARRAQTQPNAQVAA